MTTPRTSFRQIRQLLAPRWLLDGEGGLVGYALDVMKDAFVERTRLGLLARFPETAPSDALAAIGRSRRVVRGLNETEESYKSRLLVYLDDRKRQGNPFALLQKISEYINQPIKLRTVDARGNWFTRNADGTEEVLLKQGNWNWNASDPIAMWSRFWVIIYPNGIWSQWPNNWGDTSGPAWSEETGSLGSTTPAYVVDTIRNIVADWKDAGTRCINIILAFDNASFAPGSPEPDGRWETDGKLVGDVKVPARLATARYWDGVI